MFPLDFRLNTNYFLYPLTCHALYALDLLEKEGAVEVSASQLNIRGVYLHVLGDALGSVIVMISALIVIFQKGEWTQYVDPTMSIIMVVSVDRLID